MASFHGVFGAFTSMSPSSSRDACSSPNNDPATADVVGGDSDDTNFIHSSRSFAASFGVLQPPSSLSSSSSAMSANSQSSNHPFPSSSFGGWLCFKEANDCSSDVVLAKLANEATPTISCGIRSDMADVLPSTALVGVRKPNIGAEVWTLQTNATKRTRTTHFLKEGSDETLSHSHSSTAASGVSIFQINNVRQILTRIM